MHQKEDPLLCGETRGVGGCEGGKLELIVVGASHEAFVLLRELGL